MWKRKLSVLKNVYKNEDLNFYSKNYYFRASFFYNVRKIMDLTLQRGGI
jgi:hypothetical protein